MALKELLKQRVMEKLNFSQEISDEHLKGVIQEEIMKISEEYPLLLSDKIRLNQEVFYALRRLDILQDLLEDDSVITKRASRVNRLCSAEGYSFFGNHRLKPALW